ncbi:alpha-amylase family protein [Niveibacterium sp. 24ML]|uniref:alpha-amylase family protein n=1 Tax=Niveibacterium sp. 24ML TaxID=2985512 RepID=UPI002270CF65|nr:alpha-amylase family protein [Niveibacterium sp. 24ML]MCX9155309.1 alpha-amylase family protein [Niveibacterium sp. 24ML]
MAACGGGGGETSPTPTPTPTPDGTVTISAAAGTADSRLACFKGTANAACGLRTYQIMVESFVDGDASADYNVGYGTSHHKGDLKGIISALDYIKSTGVNAIWLTPVFESIPKSGQDKWADRLDATGYFASNYFKIDPKFGTLDDARALVDEAHKRGLYVFFDGVFGHHKDNVLASPTGKSPTGGTNPVSYPGSYDFYAEVATYWIKELKIDGWRLDQAYQVPVDQWTKLRAAVEQASASVTYTNASGASVNPLGYMVGEIWDGESTIASKGYGPANAPALLSNFDFPSRYRLVQTLAVEESGTGKKPASTLKEVFSTVQAGYPNHAIPNLMLTNHDLVRFGDLLQRGGIAQPSDDAYWNRHKLAFAFMAAYSGPITLYYGDEIGQEVPGFSTQQSPTTCADAGLCDDHVSRSSALIDGVATTVGGAVGALNARQSNLKNYVATLWALRDTNPALAYGSRTHVFANSTVYVDRKDAGSNRVLLVMNTGTSEASIKLDKAAIGGIDSGLTDLEDASAVSATDGVYSFKVPALSARLLKF